MKEKSTEVSETDPRGEVLIGIPNFDIARPQLFHREIWHAASTVLRRDSYLDAKS